MHTHVIYALVFVSPTHEMVGIAASEGADPSWRTFLRQPIELPEQGGLWLMTALWVVADDPSRSGYHLIGWERLTIMDYAELNSGTWRPRPLKPLL